MFFTLSVFSQKVLIKNQYEEFVVKDNTIEKYFKAIRADHLTKTNLVDAWYSNKTGLYYINIGLSGAYTTGTLIVKSGKVIDHIDWGNLGGNYHTKLYSPNGEDIYMSNTNLYFYNEKGFKRFKDGELGGEKNYILWGMVDDRSHKLLVQSTKGREFIEGKYYVYDLRDDYIDILLGTISLDVNFMDNLFDYPITDKQRDLVNDHRPIFKSVNNLVQVEVKIVY